MSFKTFTQHRIVVTGATGGIGAAVARELANAGASLILLDRELAQLDRLSEDLKKYSEVHHQLIQVDFSDSLSVREALSKITKND